MKSLRHTLPLLGLATSLAYVPMATAADFTGNAAATTNYVWRGATQTDNGSAVQGGLDYTTDLGLYAGAWASDTAFGSYELDLYGGYSIELGGVGIDIGAISYVYPQAKDDPTQAGNQSDVDWSEGYLGLSFGLGKMDLSLQANYTSNVFSTGEEALYAEAALDIPFGTDATLTLHVGSYDFDADDPNDATKDFAGYESYTDYSISLSKGNFTFTYSDTDLESDLATNTDLDFSLDDDAKVYVTWSSEFDLLK